ncbi:Tctex1 domain-containing protein 1, partial [Eufriesea mexicana]
QQQSKNLNESRISRFRSNPNLRKLSMRQVQFNEIPKYQNTYRLESFHPFHIEVVDQIVKETMESKLSPVTSYHPNHMAKLCFEIGSDLQNVLCKKDFDRYKLVVQVSIVQRLDQSVHSGFQCLWDVERDNYSYHVFENNHIYAWCCVFGMYYE